MHILKAEGGLKKSCNFSLAGEGFIFAFSFPCFIFIFWEVGLQKSCGSEMGRSHFSSLKSVHRNIFTCFVFPIMILLIKLKKRRKNQWTMLRGSPPRAFEIFFFIFFNIFLGKFRDCMRTPYVVFSLKYKMVLSFK